MMSRHTIRNLSVVCFLSLSLVAAARNVLGESPSASPRALLIGCTKYEHLGRGLQLHGGENDVELLRKLLIEKFQFPAAQIVVLSESGHNDNRPTRANIVREFEQLISSATTGGQIVIYLAGHGSQQPDVPTSVDDPEPDGLDEIFLPADARGWDGQTRRVSQAIVDDEIGAWLSRLETRGAIVTVIVDACHAGTMTRSTHESARTVPPEVLIPLEVLESHARQFRDQLPETTTAIRGVNREESLIDHPSTVAIYAAQSSELAIERLMPVEGTNRKPYGLLTYTICQLLTQRKEPMTYRDLVRSVQLRYAAMGRLTPTPLLAGRGLERHVFQQNADTKASPIILTRTAKIASVNVGRLHGISLGTVLSVHEGDVNQPEDGVHFAKITQVDSVESLVISCDSQGNPTRDPLPENARCHVVLRGADTPRIRIAVTHVSQVSPQADDLRPLLDGLQMESVGQRFSMAANLNEADWLIEVSPKEFRIRSKLTWPEGPSQKEPQSIYEIGPFPLIDPSRELLIELIERIARSDQLKSVLIDEERLTSAEASSTCAIELQIFRDGKSLELAPRAQLTSGDRFQLQLRNPFNASIDATILHLGGDCRLGVIFPRDGENNRIDGMESRMFSTRAVSTRQSLEYLITISVLSNGPLCDYTNLALPLDEKSNVRGPAKSWVAMSELLNASNTVRRKNTTHRPIAIKVVPIEITP